MSRKRYPGGSNRKEAETVKYQPEEVNYRVPDKNVSSKATKSPDDFTEDDSFSYREEIIRNKKSNKSKHSCAEICCKYNDYDCNFVCDSEKELLLRIICLLINKEYGLQAIEQKIRKSELNDDIKNINSITDLLERAIVGLGETALGAVEKAVDAAGTMSDITSGLAKIAAGAAGTAGSAAFTAQGLANVASGTAGTAGAAAHTVSGLTNSVAGTAGAAAAGAATVGAAADVTAETTGLAAAGASTVGVAGDLAAETAGLAAAGAATVGVAGDIAAETSGLAAAGAATIGVVGDIAAEAAGFAAAGASTVGGAGDIAAEAAGLAAAGAATVGGAGDIAAETAGLAAGAATVGAAADILTEEAGAAAAISSTQASLVDMVAGEADTAAAVSGTIASTAQTVSGTAGTAAAISSTTSSLAEITADVTATTATTTAKVPVALDNESDTIQICILNNNSKPSDGIRITMNSLSSSPKTSSYAQSFTVPATSAVFLTITSAPAEYEVQIDGLSHDICAYCVAINRTNDILSSQAPVEARVLYAFPYVAK